MNDDRDEIVKYRPSKAFETWGEAKMLAENKSWTGAGNRLYYACFYMVSALLLKRELYAKTHSGTKTLFHRELVKTKLWYETWGKFYQDLFDLRNEGDYEDLVHLTEKEIAPLLPKTKDFLSEIKRLLDSN